MIMFFSHKFSDFDIIPIPVIFLDNVGIIPGYLHIQFCSNRPTLNEVMPPIVPCLMGVPPLPPTTNTQPVPR